jgi:hypothetical protein
MFVFLSGFRCEPGEASRTPQVLPAQTSPARGQGVPTGNLSFARATHTATLLPNGRVLIAGGCYFGTSDRFWLNLQAAYDLDVERDWLGKRLEEEVVVRRRADQFRAG